MVRPKVKKQHASPIHMPKGNRNQVLRKPQKKFTLFKQSTPKKTLRTRKRIPINTKLTIIPLFLILFGGLIYISTKYILSLRSNAFGSKTYIVNDVVGLHDIPEYPGSEFIYKDNQDNPTVKEFLATGNSTYRLPDNKDVEDVENYYKEELTKRGWELVNTIVIGTEDKKYGQYWIKDGKGLRIYTKFRDVWYETISENDSRTALAQKVQEEIEREMLMASSEKQDLLPDYPWKIQIPKEYLIKYEATDFKDFTSVSFQRIGTNDKVTIYPVAYTSSKELDFILEDYCKIVSTEENTWEIQNTILDSFDSQSALRGTLVSENTNLYIAVVQNRSNDIVYVISTNKENDPLFGYILENIQPLDVD